MARIGLNREQYRDRVLACWLGKNIGGTLGGPFEWRRQLNDVSFYTRDLHGEPLPNDDLDIQLVWLVALEERGVDLDAHTLAEYWLNCVTPHWAEYGISKANMRAGLAPPLSGEFSNPYWHSCGAFIRSEIWACTAPAQPALAAGCALQDAMLDHGYGEGTYAAVFTAALESAAFVVDDPARLVEIGLSHLPEGCGVAAAVRTAVSCAEQDMEMHEARDQILRHHRGLVHMGSADRISPEDLEKGFDTGERGYDAPSNIAIWVYGLLAGDGDFDRTLCTTVNMGEDTDCTGATVGSVFGILHGTRAIPEKWIEPIGRSIRTVSINIGDMRNWARTVDELTNRTARVAEQMALRHGGVSFGKGPGDLSGLGEGFGLAIREDIERLYANPGGPTYRFGAFTVMVDYGGDPLIRTEESRSLRVRVVNRDRPQVVLHTHCYPGRGLRVAGGQDAVVHCVQPHLGGGAEFEIVLACDGPPAPVNRAVLELTSPGRPTAMTMPLVLLSGGGVRETD